MLNRETDLLKEVEKLENQSKIAERDKNYELAISVLMQAKDNYTKLRLNGQVSIIIKEIVRLKRLRGDDKKPVQSYREDQEKIKSETQYNSSLEKLKPIKVKYGSINETIMHLSSSS